MLKRGILVVAAMIGVICFSGAPAQADDRLIVVSYFRNSELVGQKWWGCPGQPPGQWGIETPQRKLDFSTPC
jgi:hypothetical protein